MLLLPLLLSHLNPSLTLSNAVEQARGCVATKIGLVDDDMAVFSCSLVGFFFFPQELRTAHKSFRQWEITKSDRGSSQDRE